MEQGRTNMLTCGRLRILRASPPNIRVNFVICCPPEMVRLKGLLTRAGQWLVTFRNEAAGVTVQMTVVLALPPSAGLSSLVRQLFRYGTCLESLASSAHVPHSGEGDVSSSTRSDRC
jgi:hypothetical protein